MVRAYDLYHDMVRILKEGDDDRIRSLIDPAFVMHEDEGMPYGGVYRGPDGFMELISKVWACWGGSHFEPQYQLESADGTRICAVVLFRGTPNGSAEPVETLINEIWTFRDGKAIEARVWYYDTPALLRAMGLGV